jgi:hypothetical protein
MLILPAISRTVMRVLLGVRIDGDRRQRIAAWLLVSLGLAVMVVGRVAA